MSGEDESLDFGARSNDSSFAGFDERGVNAFQFTNAAGKTVYGRYQIVPVAGAQYLSQ